LFSSFLDLLTGGLLSTLSAAYTFGEHKLWPESASLNIHKSLDNLVVGDFKLKIVENKLHAIGKAEALSLIGQYTSENMGAMYRAVSSKLASIDYILVVFSGSDVPLDKGVGTEIIRIIRNGADPKDIEEMLKDCNAILFRCQIVHPGARQSM